MNIYAWILALSIIGGQLIRFTLRADFTSGEGLSLLDLTVYLFCILGLLRLRFRLLKPPKYITLLGVFILIALISLVFTPLQLTTPEFEVSFYYTFRYSAYVLLAWLIYSDAFGNFKKQINSILFFSGVSLAILGLLQFMFLPNLMLLSNWGWDPHYFRTVSTFLDPNFAGAYFSLTLILLFTRPIKGNKDKLAFLLVYLALLTTFSRSSYLMFLISGMSLVFLKKSKKLFLIVTILFVMLLGGFQIYTQLVSKPRNIDREQSASFRLNTWQQGLKLFESHPLLGVGFNAYRYALKTSNLGDEQFINSHGASSNDSSLLFVAATTGIIGLFTYVGFLIFFLKIGLRENYVLFASINGLLIHSIFANSLFFSPIFLWLLLISLAPKK